MKPWDPHVRVGTLPNDEVQVYRVARATTWHVDPACPKLKSAAAISCVARLDQVGEWLWSDARARPCATCAREMLLDVALAAGAGEPDTARRVVLSCPSHRARGHHRGCPRCRELAAFAARHGLPAHVTREGYTLVAAQLPQALVWTVWASYLVHDVPREVSRVGADTLAVAWKLLGPARTEVHTRTPAHFNRGLGVHQPTLPDALNLLAADLIIDTPAPA